MANASLKLDGTGDYIAAVDSAAFDIPEGNWTISIFFRIPSGITQQNHYLVKQEVDSGHKWEFVINGPGPISSVGFWIYGQTGDSLYQMANVNISADVQHHIAFVKVGKKTAIYLDGVKKTSRVNNSNETSSDFNSPQYVGCSIGDSSYAKGHFDSLWIFRENIFNADPSSAANITVPTKRINPNANCMLMLDFNGTDGDTFTDDESSYNHSFTFYGDAQIDTDQFVPQIFEMTASSGLNMADVPAETREFAASASSGLNITGVPAETREITVSTSSGLAVSQEPVGTTSDLVESGFTLAGQATEQGEFPKSAASSMQLSGQATEQGEFPKSTESGLQLSGQVAETTIFNKIVTSGLTMSGTIHRTYELQSSSELEMSGEMRGYLQISPNKADGQYRIADDNLELCELYHGLNEEPDYDEEPFATFETLPQTIDIFERAWASPTANEDGYGWENGSNARNDNENDYANTISLSPGDSTGQLVLTRTAVFTDRVRFKGDLTGGSITISLQVYYDGEWHDVWGGQPTGDWEEHLLTDGFHTVTGMRFGAYNEEEAEGGGYCNIYEVDFGQISIIPGKHYFTLRRRNKWGLSSQNIESWNVILDEDGNIIEPPPNAPSNISITPVAGGKGTVEAQYFYTINDEYAATDWLIYFTDNGTDPDPENDTPTVVAMSKRNGLAFLQWLSPAADDNDMLKVIVRARRVDGGNHFDSENTDVHSCTASTAGPARPDGRASLGYSAETREE